MSITRLRRSIILIALSALVGAVMIGQPAQGAMSVVTGTVSSSNGPIATGELSFFATCQDYEAFTGAGESRAAYDYISGGEYSVNIPDGTYRVVIMPYRGTGAGTSWHNAKATCEQADVITVSGYTVLNLVALPGSDVTGTVSSSNGPVTTGRVTFYATCEVLRHTGFYPGQGLYADESAITDGRYTVTVPDGTYRVDIQQRDGSEHGALRSWHNAKTVCEQADVVTVSGNTTQNLVAKAAFMVEGTVRSMNGRVTSGYLSFFTSCQEQPASSSEFSRLTYKALVFAGTYRVLISPDADTGARKSWHSAKPTCDQADMITVSGNTTQNLLALPGKQTVKKPPARVKKGKSAALAKTSSAGTRVRWKSITRKVCTVKKSEVKALTKGKCVLRASVPKTSDLPAYTKKFTIRVR